MLSGYSYNILLGAEISELVNISILIHKGSIIC